MGGVSEALKKVSSLYIHNEVISNYYILYVMRCLYTMANIRGNIIFVGVTKLQDVIKQQGGKLRSS